MRQIGKVLNAGEMGRDPWSVRDVHINNATGGEMLFPTDCEAVSISPASHADAIYLKTIQNPDGILITSKTPFVGYLQGPIYFVPYYSGQSGAYDMQLVFWVTSPIWIPPTFLDTTVVGARNKFSV